MNNSSKASAGKCSCVNEGETKRYLLEPTFPRKSEMKYAYRVVNRPAAG